MLDCTIVTSTFKIKEGAVHKENENTCDIPGTKKVSHDDVWCNKQMTSPMWIVMELSLLAVYLT